MNLSQSPITQALLWLCTALYFLVLLGTDMQQWMPMLALWPVESGYFGPWQILTYSLFHGSLFHLFFNMMGLYMFGAEIERALGSKRFVMLLLISTIGAALAQLAFTALTGSMKPTVGASGMLFGLLGTFGLMYPNRIIMPLIPPIPMKAKNFVMLFAGIELVLGVTGGTGIAHLAHLGGLVGAIALILYWRASGVRGI
jgi:membrane associated rhomboid family serine protease